MSKHRPPIVERVPAPLAPIGPRLGRDLVVTDFRQELRFRDHQSAYLHSVRTTAGTPHLTLRAVPVPGALLVVDLDKLAPGLQATLLATHTLDMPGTVYYTLRHAFADVDAFMDQVRETALETVYMGAAVQRLAA